MSSKLFLPLLLLSFLAIAPVQPMMKSPEEQQEKTPQFWSFFLHPGTFETARGEQAERLEAEQQQQEGTKMKQEEMNTSEQGKAESDYYDAAREEDEQQKGKTNNKMENEANETAPLINLMAALRVNVDPSPVMLVEGSVEGDGGKKARNEKGEEGTMRRIVFPEAGKGNQTEKEKFVLDGDSYDEERAEMGKADEEDDGEEEGGGGKNATKMMTQPDGTGDIVVLLPKGKEILATEGMGGGRGEEEEPMVDGEAGGRRDEEEDGRWPIVDGTTGNDDDDGEEGGGGKAKDRLEPPKAAKIFGIA